MTPFRVVLYQPRDWFDYVAPCATLAAALIAAFFALWIARQQNAIQKALAKQQTEFQREQVKIQKMHLEQQERQLKKDLFDKRFTIYTEVLTFLRYVLGNDGDIKIMSPECTRFRNAMENASMLFSDDVIRYLAEVYDTASKFHVSTQAMKRTPTDLDEIAKNGELLNRLSTTLLEERARIFRPYLAL